MVFALFLSLSLAESAALPQKGKRKLLRSNRRDVPSASAEALDQEVLAEVVASPAASGDFTAPAAPDLETGPAALKAQVDASPVLREAIRMASDTVASDVVATDPVLAEAEAKRRAEVEAAAEAAKKADKQVTKGEVNMLNLLVQKGFYKARQALGITSPEEIRKRKEIEEKHEIFKFLGERAYRPAAWEKAKRAYKAFQKETARKAEFALQRAEKARKAAETRKAKQAFRDMLQDYPYLRDTAWFSNREEEGWGPVTTPLDAFENAQRAERRAEIAEAIASAKTKAEARKARRQANKGFGGGSCQAFKPAGKKKVCWQRGEKRALKSLLRKQRKAAQAPRSLDRNHLVGGDRQALASLENRQERMALLASLRSSTRQAFLKAVGESQEAWAAEDDFRKASEAYVNINVGKIEGKKALPNAVGCAAFGFADERRQQAFDRGMEIQARKDARDSFMPGWPQYRLWDDQDKRMAEAREAKKALSKRLEAFKAMKALKAKNAVITVGIPGCGKSTWAAEYAKQTGARVIELDMARAVVNGNAASQDNFAEVLALHKAWIAEAAAANQSIVVSDTNLVKQFRDELKTHLESLGYVVDIKVFFTSHEVSRARNASRDRVVPEHAMDRMIQLFDNEFGAVNA